MSETFERHYGDDILHCESHRNLVLAAWFDAPRVGHVRSLVRLLPNLRKRHPAGLAMLSLVVRGTPAFEDGMRKELTKAAQEGHVNLGTAHVILPTGLTGSATRAFLTTIFLLGRTPVPNKVFATPDEAATWLATPLAKGAEKWSAHEIHDVVTRFAGEKSR